MNIHTVKHAARLKDIVLVLLKYGFEDVVERLDVPGKLFLKKVMRFEGLLTTAERMRVAMEELGPTFIKLGQIMSMRSDLLPASVIHELRKLQDHVPPVPFAEIAAQIEKDLGHPISEVFSEFDEVAIAAASLGQVHRAVLKSTGEAVAVKVQRPNIKSDIESDLAIMRTVAKQLDTRMDGAQVYDLPNLVEEFRRVLFRELDYSREAQHLRIFKHNFAEDPTVYIPRLHTELSNDKLLVMEFVEGIRLDQVPEDDIPRRQELARRGLRIVIKQVLQDGFFHADPHPGNILVRPDNSLCLLDFGMVGRLTDDLRFSLSELIQAAVHKDSDRLLEVLLGLSRSHEGDRQSLQLDIMDLLDGYMSVPLNQLHLGKFLADTAEILRSHKLFLPQNLAVMIKAFITAEGVARELDPNLDPVGEVEPLVRQLVMENWKPRRVVRLMRSNLMQLWALQRDMPRKLSQIIEKLERGEMTIRFEHENLERFHHTFEDMASRLTVAIIIASVVVGSSLMVANDVGPKFFSFPVLGIIGYLISAFLGMWIVINILRSNRW